MLSRWVDAYARKIGQDVTRVRRWVAYMALGGALERAGFHGDGPRFIIKGGVALELRLGARARATRDLDLVLDDPGAEPVAALDAALAAGFESFSFRRHGEAHPLPRGGARVDISVEYARKGWSRIQIDLGRREGDSTEFEMVEALDSAGPVPLRWHASPWPCSSRPSVASSRSSWGGRWE
ncbi:MAG TPA: nucleotidyl transferase AbiEii/AbiGii toxin family protein [Longimicrobium sp.]|nr:nucleotidyl transferase AbiEii/AbiGii toxin family protein [Longimicrobium sp.]